ncbi:UDP-N-acetylmuramyl tripeptide synthase [Desulfotomaculum arcticum]|uniref:Lipid II isoglutaminyl synthase (glutamine-hydrolyzing) subunit MurT n=1 Tax=Desulfotruncus arcticus DSM 17038 TaxID=1121424 RepID=A0A1I2SE55_9FIRM|nr:Mur ligase family protein [Desulfotruncus arcticus]SFG50743.1 UDP-N-acetylmuramyl tripeptide synthase [Desulfotomaculum arcticum] [Desulfotruncus arcticus DSM 17038]
MIFRFLTAIWLAKIAMFMSKITGKGRGSSLPGMLALRVYPDILQHYKSQTGRGAIMITGTNGKTTTSNMLAGALEHAGHKIVNNREGANLLTGVVTSFIKFSSVTGRVNCDYAVLEVDEAAFPVVTKWIQPRIVIITNFFRDQLDRYGELDTTISKVVEALKKLSAGTQLVLNSDDPLVARIAAETGYKTTYYGIRPTAEISGRVSYSREAKFCPFCGEALVYAIYIYSQLGDYKCLKCGFARPVPDIEATAVQHYQAGTVGAAVRSGSSKWRLELPVQGLYNLYNGLAAFTASTMLGLKPDIIIASLNQYSPATGRMETFKYKDKKAVLALVKNPTGFNQALAGLLEGDEEQDLLIAINDNDADGRDISWLWDVDFEILMEQQERFRRFICTGQRAEDMAVRLKYAGASVARISIEKDYNQAIQTALSGECPVISMLATYTAVWPVEKILSGMSERVKFSEDQGMSSVS